MQNIAASENVSGVCTMLGEKKTSCMTHFSLGVSWISVSWMILVCSRCLRCNVALSNVDVAILVGLALRPRQLVILLSVLYIA